MTTKRSAFATVLLLCGMTAVILILAGSVDQLDLQPGMWVSTESDALNVASGEPGGAVPIDWSWMMAFRWIIHGAFILSVILVVIFFRDPVVRAKVLPWAAMFAILVVIAFLVSLFIGTPPESLPEEEQMEEMVDVEIPGTADAEVEVLGREALEFEEGMKWPIIVSILLTGVLLALVSLPLIALWRRRMQARGDVDPTDDIVRIAGNAARDIAAGMDAVGVVQKCYVEMTHSLSASSGVRDTYMTPREFAHDLHKHGVCGESIGELTEMFELVRYGARADDTFAERALRCLGSLRLQGESGT